MEKQYEFAWQSGIFLIVCLVLFVFARLVFKLFNPRLNVNEQLTDKDNIAFYFGYIAYFAGVLLIIGGVMNSSSSGEFGQELVYALIYGVCGIFALNLAFLLIDKLVHPRIKMLDEIITKGNIAIGILKGANYLSTGIIIGGVMLTEVDKPVESAVFLVLAVFLSGIGFLYYALIARFKVRDEIYSGNIAVACAAAGAQIAFAVLIYAGFQITHTTWQESLLSIAVDLAGGLVLLPFIRFIVDLVFIPNRKITDELIHQDIPNVGLGIFEATAYVGGALLFVWCWNL